MGEQPRESVPGAEREVHLHTHTGIIQSRTADHHGDRCLGPSTWILLVSTRHRKPPTPCRILIKKVLWPRTQVRCPRQGVVSDCQRIPGVETLPGRSKVHSGHVLRPQEFGLLHDNKEAKQMTSLMGRAFSFIQLPDLLSKRIRKHTSGCA